MTYAQNNEDEKGKKAKECNKKELKNDNDNDNNNNNNNNNSDNSNDYNNNNRKGKALKVATKKTLNMKTTSCLIFET